MKPDYINKLTKSLGTVIILLCALFLIPQFTHAALTDELQNYWSFDGEDTINLILLDEQENMNLTLGGDITVNQSGKIAEAHDLDGAGDYLHDSDGIDYTLSNGFTIQIWGNTDSWTTKANPTLLNAENAQARTFLYVPAGSQLRWTLQDDGGEKHVYFQQPSTGAWHHYLLEWNTTHMLVYIDNVLQENVTATSSVLASVGGTDPRFNLGSIRGISQFDHDGLLDETAIWNRTLTTQERGDLWNSGNGLAYPLVPAQNSTIDLIFTNSTIDNAKASFQEGEDFYSYLNYSNDIDGTILNDTVASCNMSFVDGLVEEPLSDDNFTICETGCDYMTFSETITFDSATDTTEDSVHAFVCNEQLQQEDAVINISCGAGTYSETRDGADIVNCDDGFSFVTVNTTLCIAETELNITLTYDGIFARRKRIVDAAVDREYSLDVNVATFNATTQVWEINHTHEYYKHGAATITGTCFHDTDSDLDIEVNETITIVNIPPIVEIVEVNTTLGMTTLTEGVTIEYATDVWNWAIIVDGSDDLDTINITWYNATGTIKHSIETSTPQTYWNTPNETFLLFENEYNLTVIANDTNGDSTIESITFNVSDTTAPTITHLRPTPNQRISLQTGVLQVNATCTDVALLRLNTTIYNATGIFNSFQNGTITGNSFSYQAQFNASLLGRGAGRVNTSCADSHTAQKLTKLIEPTIENERVNFTDFTISFDDNELSKLTVEKKYDRYVFNTEYSKGLTSMKYAVYADNIIVVPNSKYCGHLVVGDAWIDFEPATSCDIDARKGVTYITAHHDTAITKLTTQSVGEVNIISEEINFIIFDNTYNYNATLPASFGSSELDLTTTAGVMLFCFLLFVVISLVALAEVTNTLALNLLAGVGVMVFGFMVGWKVSMVFGLIVVGVGAIYTVIGFVR